MKVERVDEFRYGGVSLPPRTFVELSHEEVLEALRRYVCEEGVDLPAGRPHLMTADGAPRVAGFVLLVEQFPPTSTLFQPPA